jgi:hypothetical protein
MDRSPGSRLASLWIVFISLSIVSGCGSATPSGSQVAAAESATPVATAAPIETPGPTLGPTLDPTLGATPEPSPRPSLAPGGLTLSWQPTLASDDGSRAATKLGGISDAVAFGDGFVLSGSEQDGRHAVIWYSADGLAWRAIDNVPGFADGVIDMLSPMSNGLIAIGHASELDAKCAVDAVGCNPLSPIRMWTSTTGGSWHAVPAAALASFGRAQIELVAAGPTGLVAFGTLVPPTGDTFPAMVWTSANGRTWSAAPQFGHAFSQDTLFDLTAGANGYVAAGSLWVGGNQGRPRKVWYSADGRTWQAASGLTEGAGPATILACAGGYLGLDNSSDSVSLWASPDGRSWDLAPAVVNRPDYPSHLSLGVYSDGQRILAIGSDFYRTTEAWLSSDGRDWQPYNFGGQGLTADSSLGGALGTRGVVIATRTTSGFGQIVTLWFAALSS